MSWRSASLSMGSAAALPTGAAVALAASACVGLMSLIGGARFASSSPVLSLRPAEPGGFPAARKLGATTGFGGAWVPVPDAAELTVGEPRDGATAGPGETIAGPAGLGASGECWAVAGEVVSGGAVGPGAAAL